MLHEITLFRFIPNRSAMDIDAGHFRLTNSENIEPGDDGDTNGTEYRRKMSEALKDGKSVDEKILSFKRKAPQAKEGG